VHSVEMVTTLRRLPNVPRGSCVPERGPEDDASGYVVEWQLKPVQGPGYEAPTEDQGPLRLSELRS
jgi:hypothetical protein